MERITINEFIEALNALPEEERKQQLVAIGSYSENGNSFYKLHIGNTVNPLYRDIKISK